MNPITEDDIADFLLNTPDFFGRHADLLSAVMLTSPHGNRAVSLQEEFMVPQVAVKVWGVAEAFSAEPFAQGVSDDVKSLASSLMAPYVGANAGFEAVSWLADASRVASVALIALRRGTEPQAFGLMVLASPDPQRFHAGMGTDFLERMAELGSAALTRLR